MRILLVSDEPDDPGMGGPKVTRKLQTEFQKCGEQCHVMFRPQLGGPRNLRLRMALSPWLARRAVGANGFDYDVVDAASAEGWLLSARVRRRAVVVARSHGLEHRYYRELLADARAGTRRKPWTRRLWYPGLRLPQVAAALRRADRSILLSEADRRYVGERGWQRPERIEVIPHGVDAERWRQAPPAGSRRGAGVLFCGWWTVGKGAIELAQAHARLLAAGAAIRLTLLGAGEASDSSLEARIRSQFAPQSQPLLRILPRTRDEGAVFAAYREHDLLVCPSTSEGFGLAVIEALSQRLPVICSTHAGVAELLHHDRDALLVPPRDADALAAAIERLWHSAPLRAQLGEAGHRLSQELSWAHIAQRTLACYHRALASRRHLLPGREAALEANTQAAAGAAPGR